MDLHFFRSSLLLSSSYGCYCNSFCEAQNTQAIYNETRERTNRKEKKMKRKLWERFLWSFYQISRLPFISHRKHKIGIKLSRLLCVKNTKAILRPRQFSALFFNKLSLNPFRIITFRLPAISSLWLYVIWRNNKRAVVYFMTLKKIAWI